MSNPDSTSELQSNLKLIGMPIANFPEDVRAFDTETLAELVTNLLLKERIDELKHIDDPANVYVYWEGLQRPLDRIKQLQSQLREGGQND